MIVAGSACGNNFFVYSFTMQRLGIYDTNVESYNVLIILNCRKY